MMSCNISNAEVMTIFIVSIFISVGFGWLAMSYLFKLLSHVKAGWFIKMFAPTFVMFRVYKDEIGARIKLSILTKLIVLRRFQR